jgi:hypothetical protein
LIPRIEHLEAVRKLKPFKINALAANELTKEEARQKHSRQKTEK